jgi:diguanylate cyclase (GGDEF)-like protein
MHKVLIFEGAEADADLLVLELIHAGIGCEARRVAAPEDYARQLETYFPDAILCGASPPGSSGQAALATARSLCPGTPFIFVFGTVGEELAIQSVRSEPNDSVFRTSRAELASTFNRAIKEAGERKRKSAHEHAVSRLTRMYADQVREIDRLRRQHVNFRKLSRYLKASLSPSEVFAALESLGPQLFRNTIGVLYLVPSPGMHLEAAASWGRATPSEPTLTVQDCWALRQTQAHWVRDPRSELVCTHVTPDSNSILPYFCVPLFAEGAMLGLLHLRYMMDDSKSPENTGSMESGLNLATAVAEETGLALANLRVRDTLLEQSIRDPLTGLYNRRFLEEFLLREVARANRKKHPLSIIALDIDHFKRINDTSGHGAGDVVLRRIALLLQGYVRTSDIACRVGGEEFSLLLPEASMQIATQRAEDIRKAVHQLRLKYDDHNLSAITISLGVAAFPEHGSAPEALIRAADRALYDAKERGRDRVIAAAA